MRISIAIAGILLVSCATPIQEKPLDLIGKTVEYRYGESVYHVTIDSDTKLHWEAMAGDEAGVKGNESYVGEFVEPQKFFITWGEENGVGVSQILDFESGKVYNHLLRGRDVSKGGGAIKFVKK